VVGQGKVDIVVADCLVLELKAVEKLVDVHLAQALSYLKAMALRLALLINFGAALLKHGIMRVVL
jgi:GxxExxY protein